MPLCAKCHQKQATIHFTATVGLHGEEAETVELCSDCARAPTIGLNLKNLDLKELEALSVVGKKCEFCGQKAFSGVTSAGGAIYWCYDCGLEFGCIQLELCISKRPDLMQRSEEEGSFLSISGDPELHAWLEEANQKTVKILKERRRQDGRDTGS
jgi:hypothetical protein